MVLAYTDSNECSRFWFIVNISCLSRSNLLFNGKQSFYSALEVLSILCRHIIDRSKWNAAIDTRMFFLWPLRFIAMSFHFFIDAIFVIILINSHLAFVVIKFNQITHWTVSCANINHSSTIHYTRKSFVSNAGTHRTTYIFHIKSTCNGKWSNILLCHEFKALESSYQSFVMGLTRWTTSFRCIH